MLLPLLNAATLLFARQPLAHARGSEQSRDRQGADAQSFMTLCFRNNPCFSNHVPIIWRRAYEELEQSFISSGRGNFRLGANRFGPVWNCARSNLRKPP